MMTVPDYEGLVGRGNYCELFFLESIVLMFFLNKQRLCKLLIELRLKAEHFKFLSTSKYKQK